MTTTRYRLTIPEAKRFAWLYGIDKDLMIAEEMIDRCACPEGEDDHPLGDTEEAFWTAAVIRYGRCFGKGTRYWEPHLAISKLSSELQADHAYFKLMRDEMFAHSVGLGEDYTPIAYHTEFDEFSQIVNVGTGATRISSLGTDLAARLLALIKGLRPIVAEMLEDERIRLLAFVRAMPLSEIKAMGEWAPSLEVTPTTAGIQTRLRRRSKGK